MCALIRAREFSHAVYKLAEKLSKALEWYGLVLFWTELLLNVNAYDWEFWRVSSEYAFWFLRREDAGDIHTHELMYNASGHLTNSKLAVTPKKENLRMLHEQ